MFHVKHCLRHNRVSGEVGGDGDGCVAVYEVVYLFGVLGGEKDKGLVVAVDACA